MSNFLDLDDLIEELDVRKSSDGRLKTGSTENVTYNSLLNTISEIGKMAERTDKILPGKTNLNQDLTADLFANMSDSEMLSHFIPMRGIDFDQGVTENDLLSKEGKKSKEEIKQAFYADEFMPHRMMPQLNPLYQLSAFKSVVNKKSNQKKSNKDQSKEKNLAEIEYEADELESLDEMSDDEIEPSSNGKKNPLREIKKRKPRTYKYNPKPLQHKICRSFVPDDLKDGEYWARRKRNNEAAKKSREERRKKELEILNSYEIMKQEYSQIKIENIRLKARNSMLEKQVAELKCKLK